MRVGNWVGLYLEGCTTFLSLEADRDKKTRCHWLLSHSTRGLTQTHCSYSHSIQGNLHFDVVHFWEALVTKKADKKSIDVTANEVKEVKS